MRHEPHLKLSDVMRGRGRAPRCLKLPNGQLGFRRTDFEVWWQNCEEETTY
ncbi:MULTISPECIES: DNA-binding protein [Streptomyces]|uniref:DNA-binding protein n=1 Tax=Streptomyces TaxID=1883 RepID=UPI00292DED96|nr:DNA-binding protein [Streptomyces sp. NEAU-HV9]